MSDSILKEIRLDLLPTSERRKYAKELEKYITYFQKESAKLENKNAINRMKELLSNKHHKKQDNEVQLRHRVSRFLDLLCQAHTDVATYTSITTPPDEEEEYFAFLGGNEEDEIIALLGGYEEIDKTPKDENDKKQPSPAVDKRDVLLKYLNVEVEDEPKKVQGMGMAVGIGVLGTNLANFLDGFCGLSDKQKVVMMGKLLETMYGLLEQSNLSEDVIKRELFNTMNIIAQIKEKYIDLEDEEELAKKIQDECVVQVCNGIEQTSDYHYFKQKIEKSLGCLAWDKLTRNSQIFLITAELSYENWKMYGDDDIDFGPICMSVSKALEVEVTRRYFVHYAEYLEGKSIPVPKELVIRDKFGNEKTKTEEDFMLGNITGVTGYGVDLANDRVYLIPRLTDENRQFISYARKELFHDASEAQCVEIIKRHVKNVRIVCERYRNPSAHKKRMNKVSAKECLDYMIDIKRVLGEMLDDCAW